MTAYYNEIDPFAAQWLRNLIDAGHIAPGDVDERSIEDVKPIELKGYTQCHFFAGIGVWSYALRRAGWPDDKSIWTGSCPCQPFSSAGKGVGFADQRHLWPAFFHLIEQCRPACVMGEQVASKDGLAWLDLVQADLEGADYSSWAADLCAAGFGAPHIRQRLYLVAYQSNHGLAQRICDGQIQHPAIGSLHGEAIISSGDLGGLANAYSIIGDQRSALTGGRDQGSHAVKGAGLGGHDKPGIALPTNGFWQDADWLCCRDGKFRPVEPGTSPLADGAPARVGRLRGYGNAINAEVAAEFIKAVMYD